MIKSDKVQFKYTVRLLGVMLDGKLSFQAHVAKVKKECNWRMKQVCTIAGQDWGSSGADLRLLYIAYIRSIMDNGAPAWAPF
jgi:hypothetical protein